MRIQKRWMAIGALAGLGTAWWLFGCSVRRSDNQVVILRRVFGRVTNVHIFSGRAERERILFPWSEPYEQADPTSECAAIPPERWMDLNGDGRWDTWLRRVGPDDRGHCAVQYQVDTNLDAKPDWQFVLGFSDYEKGAAMMKARRGF